MHSWSIKYLIYCSRDVTAEIYVVWCASNGVLHDYAGIILKLSKFIFSQRILHPKPHRYFLLRLYWLPAFKFKVTYFKTTQP